jgi:membrane protein YdbS with pleckstrin-like domain
MHQKDKIKIIVVLILALVMGITYYFEGKESIIMKSVVGASFAIWLLTLFFLNRKNK